MSAQDKHQRQPLAIVGIGCRYPGGVDSPQALWDMLCDGRDGVCDVPAERWDQARYRDPSGATPGTMRIGQSAFIDQPLDQFDAAFFGISPREARYLDPQLRLLLEVVWEAFEDAGIPPGAMVGSDTGVYIGGFTLDYWSSLLHASGRELIAQHTGLGGSLVMLSNRISHLFDLHGPSLTMDTACSSSMVALNYACTDLWAGNTSLAIVGGANVMLRPEISIAMSRGGFLASDAHSKAFDIDADGYGRGEGSGAILVKPLAQAVEDGDDIYAAITATGVNQDGHTQGIAQPSGDAQMRLIRSVLDEAGIDEDEIVLLEAHGTGTVIGDPTEVNALAAALGAEQGGRPRYIGSVKANISHQEAGAGIAGIIKTALCLRHGAVPPQPHVRTPNPAIPFEQLGFQLAGTVEPLPEVSRGPRRACVNSFGYGGTNAHALLQEAPRPANRVQPTAGLPGQAQLLCLSARSPEALNDLAGAYARLLQGDDAPSLADVCHTAGRRRQHHRYRLAVVANTAADMAESLQKAAHGAEADRAVVRGETRDAAGLVWVFTGMGPQWWAMGRELYQAEPIFREAMEQAAEAFERCAGWSILDELLRDEADSRMASNAVAQPANFVLQAALSALLRHWGLMPAAIVGHSIGEVGAALASGALDLDQAARVAYHRSRLQQTMAGQGRLLALGVGEDEARDIAALYPGQVSVAAINSPDSSALAGSEDLLREIAATAEQEGIFARLVFGEVAYHSHQMAPLEEELLAALAGLKPAVPELPLYSTVTGERVADAVHDADYWWHNVRQPVNFETAMEALLSAGQRTFIEIGPHPVLAGAIRECAAGQGLRPTVAASLTRKAPERAALLQSLGALYVQGIEPDWEVLNPDGRHVSLPSYPWQRELYWGESPWVQNERTATLVHPFLGVSQAGPQPGWQATIPNQAFPALLDHRVQGSSVFPGAGYVEAFAAAGREVHPAGPFSLADITFTTMLELFPREHVYLHTSVARDNTLAINACSTRQDAGWVQHATARLVTVPYRDDHPQADLATLLARCTTRIEQEAVYTGLARCGLDYGPAFRPIQNVQLGDDELIAELALPDTVPREPFLLHPVLVDGCLQALAAFGDAHAPAVPVSIGRVVHFQSLPERIYCHATLTARHDDGLEADVEILDEQWRVLARLHRVRARVVESVGRGDERLRGLLYQWRWLPLEPDAERIKGPRPAPVVWGMPGLEDDPTGKQACLAFLDAVRTHRAGSTEGRASGLVVVTRGAACVVEGDEPSPAASALWGAARVARNEYPELELVLLDCDDEGSVPDVLDQLVGGGEYALREGRLYRHSLSGVEQPEPFRAALSESESFMLEVARPGRLDSLQYRRVRRRDPGPGEVEVRMQYTGLNFKDVLKALGRLDDSVLEGTFYGRSLGMEATGVVARVGSGVEEFAPGDPVVCLSAAGAFRSYLTLDPARDVLLHWGGDLPRDQIAALPVTFSTAFRTLLDMANLRRGETLLIHSAAGGVGQAAIQVARQLGARVLATAGSPEKRARILELGAEAVFDSRSLDFLDQVRAATGGRGVDVALNFLSGDAQNATVAALAPYGRMVEIGKLDIATNRGLPQGAFEQNLTFISVDIDRLLAQRPEILRDIAVRIRSAFEAGDYQPIPTRVFAAGEVIAAFRQMGDSSHMGKVILDLTPDTCRDLEVAGERFDVSRQLDPQAAYLVTGGFGGFGLRSAAWLADHGARHLVLAGRSGAASDEAREAVQALRDRGVSVVEVAADVSREEDVRRLLDPKHQAHPPLRGILHCAGVLEDATLDAQTGASFDRVFDAKAQSALYLHRISMELGLSLDLFVMYSSVSTVMGNIGQANYAAANAFLDGLAVQRRATGLPALSVAWGAIADTGMLARDPDVSRHLATLGIEALDPDLALEGLQVGLNSGAAEVGMFGLDWEQWGRLNGDLPEDSPYADLVRQAQSDSNAGFANRPDFSSMDPEQGRQLLARCIAEEAAMVLRLPPEQVDPAASFEALGMDSLMGVEFALALQDRLGLKVGRGDLVTGVGPALLADSLWPRIVAPEVDDAGDEEVDVTALSDEQVDAMLDEIQGEDHSVSDEVQQ